MLGGGGELFACKGEPALPDCDWHSNRKSANGSPLGLFGGRVNGDASDKHLGGKAVSSQARGPEPDPDAL